MTDTTTDADVQDQALVEAQPEEQHAEAVTTTDGEPTTTDSQEEEQPEEAEAPATGSEDDLADWASKKGIDLATPEGQAKALKSWHEAEKAMHRKGQEASELAKKLQDAPVQIDTENELLRQVAEAQVKSARKESVNDFKAEFGITPEQDQAMGAWLQQHPEKIELVNAGYMTLGDVYKLSGVGESNPADLKKQGGQEALEKLANKMRTSAPQGNAATGTSTSGDSLEELEERLANVTF